MSLAMIEVCEIGRKTKSLLTLTNNKWPPDVDSVALILWIKQLPEYLYQQEAILSLRSRDIRESPPMIESW
jgi:hypothetical protein